MARKESVTREDILSNAFDMAREEGIENVTTRRIADKAGCSTQPIYRIYRNMDELVDAIYERTILFYNDFVSKCDKVDDTPFVNLGLAYIKFAAEEQNLFRLLFMSKEHGGKTLFELLNADQDYVMEQINKARAMGAKDPSGIFMEMWIMIHGIAGMTITNDYDLPFSETLKLLRNSYQSFININNM